MFAPQIGITSYDKRVQDGFGSCKLDLGLDLKGELAGSMRDRGFGNVNGRWIWGVVGKWVRRAYGSWA